MEDVACRRVVDDDGLLQVSSHLAEVLDVVALVVVTAFSEQAVVDHVVNVQLVEKRVAVLRYGRSEDHDLVELTHALHEGIDAGPLDDINVVVLTFDLDWDREVGLV